MLLGFHKHIRSQPCGYSTPLKMKLDGERLFIELSLVQVRTLTPIPFAILRKGGYTTAAAITYYDYDDIVECSYIAGG